MATYRVCFVCTGNICRSPDGRVRLPRARGGRRAGRPGRGRQRGHRRLARGRRRRPAHRRRAGGAGYDRVTRRRQFEPAGSPTSTSSSPSTSGHLRALRALAPTRRGRREGAAAARYVRRPDADGVDRCPRPVLRRARRASRSAWARRGGRARGARRDAAAGQVAAGRRRPAAGKPADAPRSRTACARLPGRRGHRASRSTAGYLRRLDHHAAAAARPAPQVFAKTLAGSPPGFFAAEAAGLTLLAVTGTVAVPEVLAVDDDLLVLDGWSPARPPPRRPSAWGATWPPCTAQRALLRNSRPRRLHRLAAAALPAGPLDGPRRLARLPRRVPAAAVPAAGRRPRGMNPPTPGTWSCSANGSARSRDRRSPRPSSTATCGPATCTGRPSTRRAPSPRPAAGSRPPHRSRPRRAGIP